VGTPQVGDVLGGKFRVERVLGSGGMGVVVAAFHLQLEQRVALKLLQADAAKQPEVVTRFAREARAAARIQSEHVARVLDVGSLDTGEPYMVMEYLEGEDLEAELRAKGPLPVVETVGWVLQACEAIAQAHALGIVHRDLKPANLFLAERADGTRTMKVLDFGISKVLVDGAQVADASLTRTSAVMGSPMYMSPEQLRSARDVDARADIWALGVTAYELLCGKGPFSTGTVPEVCAAILKDAPEPPRALRKDLPEGLQAVVLRCLEKDVARRFGNIAELALALLSYGPPGSEVSIERISRVLQKGARSLRGAALPTPDGVPPSEPQRKDVVELPATKPSRSGGSLEDALAATKLERKPALPDATPIADPRATASATSISSWDGRQAVEPRRRSRAVFIAAGVVALLIAGGVAIGFSRGGGDEGQAGEAAPPSEVTPPPESPPPADVPATDVPSPTPTAVTPTPSAAASEAPATPTAAPVRGPLPKPRTTAAAAAGSAAAEPTSAPTASATSAPTATATSTPSATPTAAPTATPTAKATAKPTATPTAKP
jgi:eukaryotic-like serine/threonine-protein kinase